MCAESLRFGACGVCACAYARARVTECECGSAWVRARPHLIRVYPHPTPVAAEIILRHTAFFFFFFSFFFFGADRRSALQRAWRGSRDVERKGSVAPCSSTFSFSSYCGGQTWKTRSHDRAPTATPRSREGCLCVNGRYGQEPFICIRVIYLFFFF